MNLHLALQLLVTLITSLELVKCLPIPTGNEDTIKDRGLYSDFYAEKMGTSQQQLSLSQLHTGADQITNVSIQGNLGPEQQDFGEKFTHAVVKTAVALADTGLETAQEILKIVGTDIVEAFKDKR